MTISADAGPSRPRPRASGLSHRPSFSIPISRPSLHSASSSPPTISHVSPTTLSQKRDIAVAPIPCMASTPVLSIPTANRRHQRSIGRTGEAVPSGGGTRGTGRKVVSEDTVLEDTDARAGEEGHNRGELLRRVISLEYEHDHEDLQAVEVPRGEMMDQSPVSPVKTTGRTHTSSKSWGGSLVSGAYTAGVYGAALGLTAYRLWSGKNESSKGAATTSMTPSQSNPTSLIPQAPSSDPRQGDIHGHREMDDAAPPAYEESQALSHSVSHPTDVALSRSISDKSPRKRIEQSVATDDTPTRPGGLRSQSTSPAVNALKAVVSADAGHGLTGEGMRGGRISQGGGQRNMSDGLLDEESDVLDHDAQHPYSYNPHTPPLSGRTTASSTGKRSLQHPLLHNTPGRQFGRVYRKRFGTYEGAGKSSTGSFGSRAGGAGTLSSRNESGSASGSGSTGRMKGRRKGLKGVFEFSDSLIHQPQSPKASTGSTRATTRLSASAMLSSQTPTDPTGRDAALKTQEDERVLEQLDEMSYRIQRLIMEGQDALAVKPGDLVVPYLGMNTRGRRGRGGSRGGERGDGGGSGRRGRASASADLGYLGDRSGMIRAGGRGREDDEDDDGDDYNDIDDNRNDMGHDGRHEGVGRGVANERDRLKGRRSLPVVGLTR